MIVGWQRMTAEWQKDGSGMAEQPLTCLSQQSKKKVTIKVQTHDVIEWYKRPIK
jgi:hypothetical protein